MDEPHLDYKYVRIAISISDAVYCDNDDVESCTTPELDSSIPINIFYNDNLSLTLPSSNFS